MNRPLEEISDAELDLTLRLYYALENEKTAKRIAAGLTPLLLPGTAGEAEMVILGLLEAGEEKEYEAPSTHRKALAALKPLALGVRALNALLRGGIGSVDQLCACTAGDLLAFPGIGIKTIEEIEDHLGKKGLRLAKGGDR